MMLTDILEFEEIHSGLSAYYAGETNAWIVVTDEAVELAENTDEHGYARWCDQSNVIAMLDVDLVELVGVVDAYDIGMSDRDAQARLIERLVSDDPDDSRWPNVVRGLLEYLGEQRHVDGFRELLEAEQYEVDARALAYHLAEGKRGELLDFDVLELAAEVFLADRRDALLEALIDDIDRMVPHDAIGISLHSLPDKVECGTMYFSTRRELVRVLRKADRAGGLVERVEVYRRVPGYYATLVAANGDIVQDIALDEVSFKELATALVLASIGGRS